MRKVVKAFRLLVLLYSENPFFKASSFLINVLFKTESVFTLCVHGFRIDLRSNRTDVKVAFDSLGPEFDEVLRALPIDSSGIIIEAGGYIGTSAIKFASAFPDCDVYVIEPSSKNLRVLRGNVEPYDNIHLVEAGLGISRDAQRLVDRGTGDWGYTTVEAAADVESVTQIEEIKSITIEDIRQMSGSDSVILLKLDIEGGEFPLLESAETWIDSVDVIVIELHERIVPGVTELFERQTARRTNSFVGDEKILSVRKN